MDSDAVEVAFQYIHNAKSKDYEDFNIETAWASLKSKFAPQAAPKEMVYIGNLMIVNSRKVWIRMCGFRKLKI